MTYSKRIIVLPIAGIVAALYNNPYGLDDLNNNVIAYVLVSASATAVFAYFILWLLMRAMKKSSTDKQGFYDKNFTPLSRGVFYS